MEAMRWPHWLIIVGPLVALFGFGSGLDSESKVGMYCIGGIGVLLTLLALGKLLAAPSGPVKTSRLWKCPGCGRVFAKGDPVQREFYEQVIATGGHITAPPSTCPNCGKEVHIRDVYGGKYDLPE